MATLTRVVGLIAAVAALTSASAGELGTEALAITADQGGIIGLSNRLCGENLVRIPAEPIGLSAIHRLNESDLRFDRATSVQRSNLPGRMEWIGRWDRSGNVPAANLSTRFFAERQTGDVLVQQQASCGSNGLVGVSWSIASVPDDLEILVPGCSGQRFSADAPAQRRVFEYPMLWEAPFVLIQGKRGGVIVWADDAAYRFKTLVLDHSQRMFRLRFESRSFGPFEEKSALDSTRWRIRAYAGNWQAGAAIYRQWARPRFELLPLELKHPVWARDIRFVITMNLDQAVLRHLADECNPGRTLLYVASWRKDGYDRNYPDYTASDGVSAFVAEAHRLGFKVMLHVNYFGCDPKHPLYEQFKPWQLRDAFTGELQWWEWPANPPIKFAYINPASRAWRQLFVQKMAGVVKQCGADALHLDQTLCIYNDRNGIIDGLNWIEGSLALHRELRQALPEVALSGEGLNEITAQYEHFAQRHIWGMDHAHRTWDNRQVAMSHAISSAVLAPYTHIYGYLGMPNPGDAGMFTVWRRAYEPLGVLPTYNWPEKDQLNQPSLATAVFDQARFFQKNLPMPDFTTPWAANDLFVYKLKDGGWARFRRDQGVAFESQSKGQSAQLLERRIEGVSDAALEGSIPGWPAFDTHKLIGLNPGEAYTWSPKPRDLDAPHLSGLPAGYILTRAAVHDGFARFQIAPSPVRQAQNTIALWDYTGSVTGGVRLASGEVRTYGGLEFYDEATAGATHPDGDGLFIHPPWKGTTRTAGATNLTFLDYPLRLPDLPKVFFTSGVQLKPGAEGKSDGITISITASCGSEVRTASMHHASESVGMLELDLSSWRGKSILLHIEADPGPAGSPDFDWGRLVSPRIAVEDDTVHPPESVRFAGFPLSGRIIAATGSVETTVLPTDSSAKANLEARCRLPNTLLVPIVSPSEVSALPLKLLKTRFGSRVLFGDGIERPAYSFYGASLMEAKCGGQSRPALSLHPPPYAKSIADWWLKLPASPVRLVTAMGIRDEAKGQPVTFIVEVNGRHVFNKTASPGSGWVPIQIDLAEWKDTTVALAFLTDAPKGAHFAWAVWAEPVIESSRP